MGKHTICENDQLVYGNALINQKATGLLNKRGYRVGLLGADLSQFRD